MDNTGRYIFYYKEDDYFVKMSDSPMANSLRLGQKGFLTGVILSAFPLQHLLESHHFIEIFGRSIFKYALPIGISGAILGGTIGILDDIRGKDRGITNATIGGFIAGAFYGSRSLNSLKSFQVGLAVASISTILRFFMIGGFGINHRQEQLKIINESLFLGDFTHLYPKS